MRTMMRPTMPTLPPAQPTRNSFRDPNRPPRHQRGVITKKVRAAVHARVAPEAAPTDFEIHNAVHTAGRPDASPRSRAIAAAVFSVARPRDKRRGR
jgi:hypothetical protein